MYFSRIFFLKEEKEETEKRDDEGGKTSLEEEEFFPFSFLSLSRPRRERALSLSLPPPLSPARARSSFPFSRCLHYSTQTRPSSLPPETKNKKEKGGKENSLSSLRLELLARHLRLGARAVPEERNESDLARHLGLSLALFGLGGAGALGVRAAGPGGAPRPLPGRPHRRLLQQAGVRVDDGGVLRVVLPPQGRVVRLRGVVGVVGVPEGAALDGGGGVDLMGVASGGRREEEGRGKEKRVREFFLFWSKKTQMLLSFPSERGARSDLFFFSLSFQARRDPPFLK